MANHKSAIKRIRSSERKRLRNRYQAKTARTFIRRLRETENKTEAQSLLKVVHSMIDKLVRKNIIHRNNGAHKKSKLAKLVAGLAA